MGLGSWPSSRRHVPLHGAEHFYLVTESIPGLSADLPVLRAPDICTYFKEDAGKLLSAFLSRTRSHGGKTPGARTGRLRAPARVIGSRSCLISSSQWIESLRYAIRNSAFLQWSGKFHADDRYILGEAPELKNCFVAAGFNSVGIQSSGGAGKAIAEWIVQGHAPMDLWDVDIRRFVPFQRNALYLHDRDEGIPRLAV
jgi:4-methylaminobutanoate oxidase (formaldehyde-forming)